LPITFQIAIAASAASGAHINTIAVNAVQTTQGNNALAITGPIDLARAFTMAKAFAPATVQAGSKSTVTITFTHNANAVPVSNLSFTDTLPAGHTVASPSNATTTCGATLTATPGAGSFSLSGGVLCAGATSCTVQVSIVSSGSAGNATNTIAAGAVTTAQGATNAAAAAVLTRVLTSVTINKSFNPTTVPVGGTSQRAIQIRNNNANAIQLTGAGLVDVLPLGMQAGSPPGLAFTGAGCTFTSIALSNTLTLAGATINANSICTLTANVQATVAGNLINNLPVGIVTSAQGVTNPAGAAATLASTGSAFLTITKTDGVATVTPGGTTTYTVTVSNTGPNSVAGLSVDDAPAPGVTFTSWTCAATSGSLCTASGSGPVSDTVVLLNGGTLTYTVHAAFASSLSGTTTNTAVLGVPGSVVDTNPVSSASDTDAVVPLTAPSVTKTDGVTTYTPGATGTYAIVVSNAGPLGCAQRVGHGHSSGGRDARSGCHVRCRRRCIVRHGQRHGGQLELRCGRRDRARRRRRAADIHSPGELRRRHERGVDHQHRERHGRAERRIGERLGYRHPRAAGDALSVEVRRGDHLHTRLTRSSSATWARALR
jgi:uncharacterized repeat protein (TIGR01451 family)